VAMEYICCSKIKYDGMIGRSRVLQESSNWISWKVCECLILENSMPLKRQRRERMRREIGRERKKERERGEMMEENQGEEKLCSQKHISNEKLFVFK